MGTLAGLLRAAGHTMSNIFLTCCSVPPKPAKEGPEVDQMRAAILHLLAVAFFK